MMATTKPNNQATSHQQGDGRPAERPNGLKRELYGQPVLRNWRKLVEPDPNRPGEDRARLVDHGIAVWAIVGHVHALGDEITPRIIAQAAEDFRVPVTAITTALAYYGEHRAAIDTRLAINAAAVA